MNKIPPFQNKEKGGYKDSLLGEFMSSTLSSPGDKPSFFKSCILPPLLYMLKSYSSSDTLLRISYF